MAGYQVGKFSGECYLAGFCQVQQRQFVKCVCQPLAFRFVGDVESPQGVFDGFVTKYRFSSQRHFRHVHNGGPQREVGIELVVEVQSHHRFSLHIVGRLVFQRDTDRSSGSNDTFIQDSNGSRRIIDRIVHIFR